MKLTNLSLSGALLVGASLHPPAFASEVRATIDGVTSTKGHVICGIFRSAEGFPKESQRALKWISPPASPPGVWCDFSDLPAGTYTIAV
jgi:uncharacterized protein (DUF2141 family)